MQSILHIVSTSQAIHSVRQQYVFYKVPNGSSVYYEQLATWRYKPFGYSSTSKWYSKCECFTRHRWSHKHTGRFHCESIWSWQNPIHLISIPINPWRHSGNDFKTHVIKEKVSKQMLQPCPFRVHKFSHWPVHHFMRNGQSRVVF